jgi:hypothetical protein
VGFNVQRDVLNTLGQDIQYTFCKTGSIRLGPCACACLSKHAYMRSVTLIQSSKPSGTMQLDTVMKSTCCELEQASPRG